MKLKLRDNAAQVERDIDKFVEGVIRAKVRAANTVIAQAERAGFAEIQAVYQIAPKVMSGYASTRLASQGEFEASITVKGRGFPLSVLNPVRVPGPGGGVSVVIKGKRVLIPHAFFLPGKGQHVFARGAYAGKGKGTRPTGQTFGRFAYDKGGLGRRRGKDRSSRHGLPIAEMWTFGPAEAFGNQRVITAMDDTVANNMPKQLQRELGALGRGY